MSTAVSICAASGRSTFAPGPWMSGALGGCVSSGVTATARFCALAARCAFSQSGQSVCFAFEGVKILPQLAHLTFNLAMRRSPCWLLASHLAPTLRESIGVPCARVNYAIQAYSAGRLLARWRRTMRQYDTWHRALEALR